MNPVTFILSLPKFEGMMVCFGATFLFWAGAGALEVFHHKKPLGAIVILGLLGGVSFISAFYFMAK